MDSITQSSHAELDIFLIPRSAFELCQQIKSNRNIAMNSHHFLVLGQVNLRLSKISESKSKKKFDLNSLQDDQISQAFSDQIENDIDLAADIHQNIDSKINFFKESILNAAEKVLPQIEVSPHRPWISSRTLKYIDQRNNARQQKNQVDEKKIQKQIRASMKQARTIYLRKILISGS